MLHWVQNRGRNQWETTNAFYSIAYLDVSETRKVHRAYVLWGASGNRIGHFSTLEKAKQRAEIHHQADPIQIIWQHIVADFWEGKNYPVSIHLDRSGRYLLTGVRGHFNQAPFASLEAAKQAAQVHKMRGSMMLVKSNPMTYGQKRYALIAAAVAGAGAVGLAIYEAVKKKPATVPSVQLSQWTQVPTAASPGTYLIGVDALPGSSLQDVVDEVADPSTTVIQAWDSTQTASGVPAAEVGPGRFRIVFQTTMLQTSSPVSIDPNNPNNVRLYKKAGS